MIKIGITGQSGFIGTHLYNYLSLKKDEIIIIPFKDEYFQNKTQLNSFVKQCDTIVHLAALNRHNDQKLIYGTNIGLVKKLIESCEDTESKPHIIFSSSIQEGRDNLYGKSKQIGRESFEEWAKINNASFTGLIIPNVFGPFGKPYYNSVIATFCHQLTHGEEPRVDVDIDMKLLYVMDLVEIIYNKIKEETQQEEIDTVSLPAQFEKNVSEILSILRIFKELYFEKGIFPDLSDAFNLTLFNTFVCYIDHEHFFPFQLNLNSDERGLFVETVKLNSGGQISFSTTRPGVTRGNHFHTRKVERFAVVRGKARIEFRRIGTDKIFTFDLDGEKPAFVDMPVWFTHNIMNVGHEDVYTIFWINEEYNPEDQDTYFEEV